MAFGWDGNGSWNSDLFPTQDRDDGIPILASKFDQLIQQNCSSGHFPLQCSLLPKRSNIFLLILGKKEWFSHLESIQPAMCSSSNQILLYTVLVDIQYAID